jgi:Ca2+-binding RTX toxin-like protein
MGSISRTRGEMALYVGGSGPDNQKNGTEDFDEMYELDGNDRINGNDRIYAGFGNHVIDGGAGNDIIDGLLGTDILSGGAGNDDIFSGETIYDEGSNDTSNGGPGNDSLSDDMGNDVHYGNEGDDDFRDFVGNDIYNGGIGNDRLTMSVVQDSFTDPPTYNNYGTNTFDGSEGYDEIQVYSDLPNITIGTNNITIGDKGTINLLATELVRIDSSGSQDFNNVPNLNVNASGCIGNVQITSDLLFS